MEVKTGSNDLATEQLENYLDVARGPGPDGDDQRRRRPQQVGQPDAVQRRPERPTRSSTRTATTTSSSAASATTSCTAARATTRSPAPRRCRPLRPALRRTTRPAAGLDDCVIGLVRLDYGHPWNIGDDAALRRRHEPVALERPRRRPPRRVPALQRVRPAPRDPLRRRTATPWRCLATSQGGHTCSDTGGPPPTFPDQYFLNFASNEGPAINGCVADLAERQHVPQLRDRQQRRRRRDLRRPRQRLARRRHRQRHALGRLGQRPA